MLRQPPGQRRQVRRSRRPPLSPCLGRRNSYPPEKTEDHYLPAIRIWFEDNGIGICKDACQEKIFRMFQRMYREEEYPGTGVGLTIVKKAAVERMNGRGRPRIRARAKEAKILDRTSQGGQARAPRAPPARKQCLNRCDHCFRPTKEYPKPPRPLPTLNPPD